MAAFSRLPGAVGSFLTRIINSSGSIRNRLLISTVGLILVVLPVMGIVTYNISYGILEDMLVSMSMSTAIDAAESMDMVLDDIRSIVDNIAFDETIRKAYYEEFESLPGIEKMRIASEIDNIVMSNGNLNLNAMSLHFFGENGLSYSIDNMLYIYGENGITSSVNRKRHAPLSAIGAANFISSDLYVQLLESGKDSILLLDSELSDDYLSKQIVNSYSNCAALFCLIKNDSGKSMGALVLIFDMDYMKSIVFSRPIAGTSYYIIKKASVNNAFSGNPPVAAPEMIIWSSEITTEKIDKQAIAGALKENTGGYSFVKTHSGDALVLYNPLQNADWTLAEVATMSSHMKNLDTIKKTTVILVSFFIIAAIIAALFLSNHITGSLKSFAGLFKWNGDLKLLSTYTAPERKPFDYIGRMSFQKKITLILIPVIIIPVITFTSISLYVTSNIIKSGDIGLWKNAFNQATKKMDFDLTIKRDILQLLFRNAGLQKILANSNNNTLNVNYRDEIEKALYNINFVKNRILYINIYNADGNLIYSSLAKFRDEYIDYDRTVTLKELFKDDSRKMKWIGTYTDIYNNYVFAAAREIMDTSFNSSRDFNRIGYVLLAFDEKILEEYFSNIGILSNLELSIINESERIISDRDKSRSFNKLDWYDSENKPKYEEGYVEMADRKQHLILATSSAITGWQIIGRVPMNHVEKNYKLILRYNLILLLIAVAVFSGIAYSLSRQISKPLKLLVKNISLLEKGNFDINADNFGCPEFSELAGSFNNMVVKLKELIKEVYESKIARQDTEIKMRQAELDALQSQINPHFLYNTLDSIRCKAMFLTNGENEVSDMLFTLSSLFRLSIRLGSELVLISSELEHVKCYLAIEAFRFGDKVSVKWDINQEIMEYKTVKLILQPIVENSIFHGLEPMKGNGLISIRGLKIDDRIKFEITDDGIGIRECDMEKVLKGFRSESGSKGIGLANVNQRIKLNFGDEYGINISSKYMQGTTVTITIPAVK